MSRADRLLEALANLPLQTVYIFGSQAQDTTTPLSDVDIAIVPQPSVEDDERLRLTSRVSMRAAAAFETDQADVILLDEAPPGIAFEAIRGERILDEDPAKRIQMEARIQSAYHDRRYYEERWEREALERYKKEGSS